MACLKFYEQHTYIDLYITIFNIIAKGDDPVVIASYVEMLRAYPFKNANLGLVRVKLLYFIENHLK